MGELSLISINNMMKVVSIFITQEKANQGGSYSSTWITFKKKNRHQSIN
jgi:hypothetical protein